MHSVYEHGKIKFFFSTERRRWNALIDGLAQRMSDKHTEETRTAS